MKSLLAAACLAGAASLLLGDPAHAASIVTSISSVPGFIHSLGAEIDFEQGPPGYINAVPGFEWSGSGQVLMPPSSGTSSVPFGDTSNFYMSVPGGGSETLTVDTTFLNSPGLSYLQVFIGSLDKTNSITFFSGANSEPVSGTTLLGSVGAGNDAFSGDQTSDNTNRFFTFFFDSSMPVTSVEFASTTDSFEFDNLNPGVIVTQEGGGGIPEPNTWVTMLAGFALLGLALRTSGLLQSSRKPG